MGRKNGEMLLARHLGSSPVLRIIDFFLDNPLSDYSKNEIVKRIDMGRATFFKYWTELEKSGAVKMTRKIGRATLYNLDRENEVVKHDQTGHGTCKKFHGKDLEKDSKPVIAKSR